MTTFADVRGRGETRPPKRIVVLGPDAFSEGYAHRPDGNVAIGIRQLCQEESDVIVGLAAREADKLTADSEGECIDPRVRDHCLIEQHIRFAVARAATDPNDAATPFFQGADEVVRVALTTSGMRRLWDELVQVTIGSSESLEPIDADEAQLLARILAGGKAIPALPAREQTEVRKLLAYCLEQLRLHAPDASRVDTEPEHLNDGDASEGEDEEVYHLRGA